MGSLLPFGLLATRDPGSSSEGARAVPPEWGAARVSEEERVQGGEGGGRLAIGPAFRGRSGRAARLKRDSK